MHGGQRLLGSIAACSRPARPSRIQIQVWTWQTFQRSLSSGRSFRWGRVDCDFQRRTPHNPTPHSPLQIYTRPQHRQISNMSDADETSESEYNSEDQYDAPRGQPDNSWGDEISRELTTFLASKSFTFSCGGTIRVVRYPSSLVISPWHSIDLNSRPSRQATTPTAPMLPRPRTRTPSPPPRPSPCAGTPPGTAAARSPFP